MSITPSGWVGRCTALLVALWAAQPAQSAFFEKFFMPGPLAAVHAEFESDCKACHVDADKASPKQACLACHDHANVRLDIEQGRGYHGRLSQLQSRGCSLCHDEHRGRDADILNFQPGLFDHALTDFELRGRHLKTSCGACHRDGAEYHEAPALCIDCHESIDPHDTVLGDDCAACHVAASWKEHRYDHERDANYALTGKHEKLSCLQCHPANRYENTPTDCIECHKIDDVHLGDKGSKCVSCHSVTGWAEIRFDHDRKTDFKLRGAHRELACRACHQPGAARSESQARSDCVDCHRADDVHKARNGAKCEDCHAQTRWSEARFEHAGKTGFKLTGRHAKLVCTDCHKGKPEDEKKRNTCNDCHAHNDVHRGVLSNRCENCHDSAKWSGTKFDHLRETDFELVGEHRNLRCLDCHTRSVTTQKLSPECYDCHRPADVHKAQLGRLCEACHDAAGWLEGERFDHELTRFPLLGQHGVQSCEACHDSLRFKDSDSACVACHRDDDAHRQTLGERCQRCHNPNAWTAWLFDHAVDADFKLDGPHADLRCTDCHTVPATGAMLQSAECYACHRSDDLHGGGFGRDCVRCHQGDSFSEISLPR